MRQQAREPLHDGQPDAQPLRPIAARITDLIELVEDAAEVLVRDADAGVADVDPHQRPACAGSHHHAATRRVLQRVVHEVGQQPLQQLRIASTQQGVARSRSCSSLSVACAANTLLSARNSGLQLHGPDLRRHLAGIQPRDVQQDVERIAERSDCIHQACRMVPVLAALELLLDDGPEQCNGVQGLPQIVARCREEARLLLAGTLGRGNLVAQLLGQRLLFERMVSAAVSSR